jgi:hypothetical protein
MRESKKQSAKDKETKIETEGNRKIDRERQSNKEE